MTAPTKSLTDNANDSDEEIRVSGAPERQQGQKPRLLVEDCNPDCTLAALRNILASAGGLYDRGVPVRLAFDQVQRGTVAQVMTPDGLVLATRACAALMS